MDNRTLIYEDEQWKLKNQGSPRAIKTFQTKEEGIDFSTDYMRKHGSSLKIRKQDGTIQEAHTYPRSADPRRSKG